MLKTSRFLHSVLCIVDVKAETSWFIITRCVVNVVLSLCIHTQCNPWATVVVSFCVALFLRRSHRTGRVTPVGTTGNEPVLLFPILFCPILE
jgi:hypothetical protein